MNWLTIGMLLFAMTVTVGCGRKGADDSKVATTPTEAAGQLDGAFASAPADFRNAAGEASAALRSGDYSKAVESLSVLRGSESVSLQQGVAVHSSMVMLESRLIAAADAGDPKAKEAYAQLRRMKQK